MTAPEAVASYPPANSSHILTVQEQKGRCTLGAVNPRKVTGPDGVPGRVLKEWTDQLAGVFVKIFSLALA